MQRPQRFTPSVLLVTAIIDRAPHVNGAENNDDDVVRPAATTETGHEEHYIRPHHAFGPGQHRRFGFGVRREDLLRAAGPRPTLSGRSHQRARGPQHRLRTLLVLRAERAYSRHCQPAASHETTGSRPLVKAIAFARFVAGVVRTRLFAVHRCFQNGGPTTTPPT